MILDLRTYHPDSHVNLIGHAFDYKADRMALTVARDMLEVAQAELARAQDAPVGESQYALVKRAATCRLLETEVTLLMGAVEQAVIAVASYPRTVTMAAAKRFDF